MLKLFTVQWRHVATEVTEDDYLKTQCHHLFVNKETNIEHNRNGNRSNIWCKFYKPIESII